MREGCSLSPFLFNIVFEVLTRVLRKEKETEGIQLSLFADSLILYIKDLKYCTRKLEMITSASAWIQN